MQSVLPIQIIRCILFCHVIRLFLCRLLTGTPCLSDAAFHGARTSDVKAAAEAIRASLHPGDKLFVVGFSLGGIIVTNAIARQQIDCVDGAVSISGCFDTAKNINFAYSRKLWQPLLAFGLKENFVAREGAAEKVRMHVCVCVRVCVCMCVCACVCLYVCVRVYSAAVKV